MIKTVCVVAFNNTVMNSMTIYAYCVYYNWKIPFASTDPEKVPDAATLLKHMVIITLCEDFAFWMTHRICHIKIIPIYKYIHKMHHEYTDTISLAATYAHPVEFVLGNHLTSYSALFILGDELHMWTIIIGTMFGLVLSTD